MCFHFYSLFLFLLMLLRPLLFLFSFLLFSLFFPPLRLFLPLTINNGCFFFRIFGSQTFFFVFIFFFFAKYFLFYLLHLRLPPYTIDLVITNINELVQKHVCVRACMYVYIQKWWRTLDIIKHCLELFIFGILLFSTLMSLSSLPSSSSSWSSSLSHCHFYFTFYF